MTLKTTEGFIKYLTIIWFFEHEHLMHKLINSFRNFSSRMTIQQALEHPWLNNAPGSSASERIPSERYHSIRDSIRHKYVRFCILELRVTLYNFLNAVFIVFFLSV